MIYKKKLRVEIVWSYITQPIYFHKVVFTDESRFSLDGNDNFKTWALKKRPYKGGSIMVWGAITYTGQLLLRRIEGSLNSEKYYRILTNDIFTSLKATIESFIFQHNNALCHNKQYTRRQIQMDGIEISLSRLSKFLEKRYIYWWE